MLPSLKKVTPLFLSNPPLKVEVLSSPTLFENLVGGSTPPLPSRKKRGGGAHYAPTGASMILILLMLFYDSKF